MIKVAFDAQSMYGKKSGLGVYVTALADALKQNGSDDINIDFFPDTQSSFCGSLSTPKRIYWEVVKFPRMIKAGNYDVVHVPAFATGWSSARTVLTVHDLIGMTFPNQTGIASRYYWGTWLPWAAKRADHIIADSESTRSDITRLLSIRDSKITLIYPSGHESYCGVPPAGLLETLRLRLKMEKDYFLCVGTLEPRKNLKRVIEAFQLLVARQKKPLSLVLVGAKDFAGGQFYRALYGRDGNLAKEIIFPGYLQHDELHALYAGAQALVFPSLYEGFGLPILEAMAAGCPVITSRSTSLPEVAGDAALYADPQSAESIADAMEIIYIDPVKRGDLVSAGHVRIQIFSWRNTALQTIEVYKKVAHGG